MSDIEVSVGEVVENWLVEAANCKRYAVSHFINHALISFVQPTRRRITSTSGAPISRSCCLTTIMHCTTPATALHSLICSRSA